MSTPLPISLPNSGNLVSPVGPGTDLPINQPPGSGGSGFDAVFGEAVSTMPATSTEEPPAMDDVQEVIGQLQDLPQGGKLLPLLRQVLVTAESEGRDPQLLLQQFSQDLKTLEQDPALTSTEAAFAALYQVAESLAPVTVGPAVSARIEDSALRGPARPALLEQLERQLGMSSDGERTAEALPQAPEPELKLSGLERALSQASQASNAASQRHADFEQFMAGALKRSAAAEQLPAGLDSPAPRSESALSAAAVSSTAAGPSSAVTTTGSAVPASLNINVPLNQANWDQALSERVQWMVGQRVQGAHIRLNPENLGPVEIKLHIQNDQASVQFSSTHGVVREALDAAIPRLREMLEASGVELVDVDISGQSFARQEAGEETQQPFSAAVSGDEGEESLLVRETPVAALVDSGRLDLFA